MQLPEGMVGVQRHNIAASAGVLVGTSWNFRTIAKRPAVWHVAGGGFIHVCGRSLLAAFCADDIRAGSARDAVVEDAKNNSGRVVFELRV